MIRALCALLLLFAMALPAFADSAQPLNAILLVAQAELVDPNFKGSIVLVMNNIAPAPAGIVINRPTTIAVSRLFPDIERLAQLDDKLYFGGPVELTTVSFLVQADVVPEHATEVVHGLYLSADRELLRKLLNRDKPMEGLRIFIGYSGWAPGQLEAELAHGAWTLAPADAGTIYDAKPERPWPEQETPEDEHHT